MAFPKRIGRKRENTTERKAEIMERSKLNFIRFDEGEKVFPKRLSCSSVLPGHITPPFLASEKHKFPDIQNNSP